jgi:phosphatidylglycerophosphatase A
MRVRIAGLVSTWFGCGYFPFAPGTVGSAAAVAIAIALHYFFGFAGWHFGVMAAIGFLPAVWAAGVTAEERHTKDPSVVVVDEVIGQWVSLAGALPFNWKSCLAAFFLFRLFDIWKPAPARQFEALPGGLGINADDVMAGIYAAVLIYWAGRLGWMGT